MRRVDHNSGSDNKWADYRPGREKNHLLLSKKEVEIFEHKEYV